MPRISSPPRPEPVVGDPTSPTGATGKFQKPQFSSQVSGMRVYDSESGGRHSINKYEVAAYANYINRALADDPLVQSILPLDTQNAEKFFEAFSDGYLLQSLVSITLENAPKPEKVRRRKHSLVTYEILNGALATMKENHQMRIVNVHANHFIEARPNIILSVLWQLMRIRLLSSLALQYHPELVRLLQKGEDLEHLYSKDKEEVLIGWVNYHLTQAGSNLVMTNFGKDLQNCNIYEVLLAQLAPDQVLPMRGATNRVRADEVIQNALRLGAQEVLTTGRDIDKCNVKMNVMLLAQIFNARSGINKLSQGEVDVLIAVAENLGNQEIKSDLDKYREHTKAEEEEAAAAAAATGTEPGRAADDVEEGPDQELATMGLLPDEDPTLHSWQSEDDHLIASPRRGRSQSDSDAGDVPMCGLFCGCGPLMSSDSDATVVPSGDDEEGREERKEENLRVEGKLALDKEKKSDGCIIA